MTLLCTRIGNRLPQLKLPALTLVACLVFVALFGAIFPGASLTTTLVYMASLSLASGITLCAKGVDNTNIIIIILLTTAVAIGIILNINYYTVLSGATDASPCLQNEDANRVWLNALSFYNGTWQNDGLVWNFYGAVVAATFLFTGPSITSALMVSMASAVATFTLTALITKRLTDAHRTTAVSVLCIGAVCYLMASATILVKDIWVVAAFAAGGYGLCQWRRSSVLWVLAAIIMLGIARKNMILAMIMGLVITALPHWRNGLKKQILLRAALIIIGVLVILITQHVTISPTIGVQLGGVDEYVASHQGARHVFLSVIGSETNTDVLRKILFSPALILTQFLIPLPWDYARDTIFGPTLAYAHFGYPWYLFGAIFVYYLCAAKSRGSKYLLILAVWGVLVWLVPVYITLGTVSRYSLCAIPLMAPAVATVVTTCYRRRGLWLWLAFFAIAMATGLIYIHHLQYSVQQ